MRVGRARCTRRSPLQSRETVAKTPSRSEHGLRSLPGGHALCECPRGSSTADGAHLVTEPVGGDEFAAFSVRRSGLLP
jgi:hypothetical protein